MDFEQVSGFDSNKIDRMLISLVSTADNGVEFGITLSAKGIIISGLATSIDNFLDGIAEKTKNSGDADDPTRSLYVNLFSEFKATLGASAESAEEEKPRRAPYGFIHLREARLYLPGNQSMLVDWWRCRLDEVDGWTFGEWNHSTNQA
jgi:hypothetical protein